MVRLEEIKAVGKEDAQDVLRLGRRNRAILKGDKMNEWERMEKERKF